MNPGPGQADKNGLRLQTRARAPCLVGCRSSEAIFFPRLIEIDDRIDRKELQNTSLQYAVYT